MPELPEVETIRLGLQKYLVGKTIEDVEVRLPKIVTGDVKSIIGAKITGVKRFGKGLVIELDNNYSIAAHIKLTGQFIYRDEKTSHLELSPKVGAELPNRFTHVIFKFKSPHFAKASTFANASADRSAGKQNSKVDDEYLYYNDIRQFGWIKIVKSDEIKSLPFFKGLGPEPFRDLTLEVFEKIVKKSNVAIKPLIMDQKKISGVGNIYANDALFKAEIDPRRSAKQITEEEIKKLYDAILYVLKKGLDSRGASELNFVDAFGQDGTYQNHFLAYAQDGKPCKRCKTPIRKITLGGRGTYFCPSCQH